MFLQEGSRNVLIDFIFYGLFNDWRFAIAPSQHDNLVGIHDRSNTHSNGVARYVLFTKKAAGCICTSDLIARNQTRSGCRMGAGLTEANVAGAADTTSLNTTDA